MTQEKEQVEHFSRADRDLLITMHEQIKNIRADIKNLQDGTAEKLRDLETRMRAQEKFRENWTGKNAIIALIVMFMLGLLGTYVGKLL